VLSCRPVADTGKMSMHGYAVAIDLNLRYSDYWLWAGRGKSIPYKNRMPQEIVDIFDCTLEQASQDVETFIGDLAEHGLIAW